MKILLLEDDGDQAEEIKLALEGAFRATDVDVVDCEAAFRERFASIAAAPPDLFIVDVMLRWSTQGRQLFYASPRETTERFEHAGPRCAALLLSDSRTSQVPVLLYSVLDRQDYASLLGNLPPHYSVLRKEPALNNLILHIRSLFPNLSTPETSLWRKIRDSVGASVGWGGVSVDLAKLFSRKRRGA